MSWKSSSGVAKLIRAPCFLPLNASRARPLTSLSVATPSVTVFIYVSMPQRHSRNLLTVSLNRRSYSAFQHHQCADDHLSPLHCHNAVHMLSLKRALTDT